LRRAFLLWILGLAGCAGGAGRVVATVHPAETARALPLMCPEGRRVVERELPLGFARECTTGDGVGDGPAVHVYTNSPGTELSVHRGALRAGARDGPWTVAGRRADLDRDELSVVTYLRGERLGQASWQLVGGRWRSDRLHLRDAEGRVVAVHHHVDGYALDAEMPAGTGAFRITDARGRLRARGQCVDGLREGAWVELDESGGELARTTYARGILDGAQATRTGRGLARAGRRVGTWTVPLPERCAIWGRQGDKCGFVPCATVVAPATVTLRYRDSDGDGDGETAPEVVAVAWDQGSSAQRVPALLLLPTSGSARNTQRCDGLVDHAGRADLP